ncbi:type I restriction-modification system subunit M [Chryseobacterium carnipullorum]|uniref:site-specific DNA-methyltransferase (adenine-specific) n=1 Tax=Chryseobacterium carnipullorum TaxID=1124835 RepID=A0A376DQM7_CHRCU|nr:type I restriction-modification system subunit M [Chryseobacterium carnipullorum]AZA48902.1 type I restriction-modification system subunit M [Chryseobacterium carnipullorum]AZA63803.1 type I restriction-modification system subunit M [Chryseobacterium carnipullorum]STC93483.1 Type I restriction enzyme EcoKI M protein [Chryseobacterium carnipullorum]
MAIKKSELYSSLWASCDELRGGMDASQYKDYVLTMLFVKYISDKYKGDPFGAITVPAGATFDDMVDLVGSPEIGDKINKQILNPIKEANKLNEFPDFNDESKLGKGKDLVDTVSNLVRIFNDPSLDFSSNSAEGDDILGDAYEYLMRHFATESGKSKGQFYTPAEVSRVLAKVIGINQNNSSHQTMAYDPTCGSGSLLLKVMNEAGKNIDLYGQEKETTTANLAHMNMILHGAETATIIADNTLSRPFYKEDNGSLKKFDYVVANPPFSLKSWSNGVNVDSDEHNRFALGVPPEKNGDYAFLLHILQSLKANGKGAVVLPHGVLFRGNAEGEIRKNILKKGYIKAIIGLPANLFYGTGIPACIIVLDKENAEHRKGLFMIDASKGFVKDGNKNRLREQDIRKITDVFDALAEVPKFSRMVSMTEIADPKNDYNLNIPRYIDTQEAEDIQDLAGHLSGGIPQKDVAGLQAYWDLFPSLKADLFNPARAGYFELKVPAETIKTTIFNHPEFVAFNTKMHTAFDKWLHEQQTEWNNLDKGFAVKEAIETSAQGILEHFEDNALVNRYAMYQHLMQYWNEVMQDDFYSIALDGWKAGNEYTRLVIKGKKGKDGKTAQDKEIAGLAGIEGRMVTPEMMIHYFFKEQNDSLQDLENQLNLTQEALAEIEEENSGEEGIFSDLEKINLKNVKDFYKERKADNVAKEELKYIKNYIDTQEALGGITKLIKIAKENLEVKVVAQYPLLTEAEIKDMVINHKWTPVLQQALQSEQEKLSQNLTQRIKELADRYQQALPTLETKTAEASRKVLAHLQKMGLVW